MTFNVISASFILKGTPLFFLPNSPPKLSHPVWVTGLVTLLDISAINGGSRRAASASQHLQDPSMLNLPSGGQKLQRCQTPADTFNASPKRMDFPSADYQAHNRIQPQKTSSASTRETGQRQVCSLNALYAHYWELTIRKNRVVEPGSWAHTMTSCVVLGKWLPYSGPQFQYPQRARFGLGDP